MATIELPLRSRLRGEQEMEKGDYQEQDDYCIAVNVWAKWSKREIEIGIIDPKEDAQGQQAIDYYFLDETQELGSP